MCIQIDGYGTTAGKMMRLVVLLAVVSTTINMDIEEYV